jgi:hypothetical protein
MGRGALVSRASKTLRKLCAGSAGRGFRGLPKTTSIHIQFTFVKPERNIRHLSLQSTPIRRPDGRLRQWGRGL